MYEKHVSGEKWADNFYLTLGLKMYKSGLVYHRHRGGSQTLLEPLNYKC